MKNTYNLSLVRRRIQEALPRPLSAIGESALEAFLAVPGASAWRPPRFGLKELSYVFDIGLPFALIGDDASVHSRRLRAGEAVRDGLYPERCMWNEIHVAAILHAWGAQVCFAPQPTPSIRCLELHLPGGEILDIEVWGTPPGAAPVSTRARLIAVDVRALSRGDESSVVRLEPEGREAADLVAVVAFEPRFWIGLQQKEWLYSIRVNPGASVKVPLALLGNADGRRHSMRFPLIT